PLPFLLLPPPPPSPLFPYTTLFRSSTSGRPDELTIWYAITRPSLLTASSITNSFKVSSGGTFSSDLVLPKPKRVAKVVSDGAGRSEEHTSELQSRENLVCRLLLEKK